MAEPMTDARLDEISALADQYREKRTLAQNALIDHNRNEVLRQESYAASIAQIFAEEYGPQLLAEVRRAKAAEAFWQEAADKNGQLYSACENQRDDAREEIERLRAARPVSDARLDRLAAIAATPAATGQQPELCEGVQQLVAKVRQLREMYHSACDRADNLGAQLQGCWDKNNQLGEENARLRAQLAAKEAGPLRLVAVAPRVHEQPHHRPGHVASRRAAHAHRPPSRAAARTGAADRSRPPRGPDPPPPRSQPS